MTVSLFLVTLAKLRLFSLTAKTICVYFQPLFVAADLANPQPMGKRNFSSVKQSLPALNRWRV